MTSSKSQRRLKVVEVSGGSYEMGYQYGKACPEIATMLDIIREVFGGAERVRRLAGQYIPLYLPSAQAYAPEIIEEMRGMADGAGVAFEDIFFLNITYEIAVPTVMGCTSFAVTEGATENGETFAGQNFDYLALWEDFMVLLKMKPVQGPAIMAVAPVGCLGLIGLNSAGISLNLNLLRNKASLSPDGGVPTHIILRKALSCDTISRAIGLIVSAGRKSAKNYLLASGQGDIIDVETTSDDVDIQYPEDGILTHANHFKAERFRPDDLAPLYWPDSFLRSQRLFQLLRSRHGSLSVDVIKQLLADHNNHPNSVCRHPDPDNPLPMARGMKTLVSIISCPGKQKAWIALGSPCENDYLEYSL